MLASYWLLMVLVPVPGCGAAGQLDVDCNLAHYVDRVVLGQQNYQDTKTWDPEGIVSTLPSIATALFGIIAGHVLRLKRELAERTTWIFAGSPSSYGPVRAVHARTRFHHAGDVQMVD